MLGQLDGKKGNPLSAKAGDGLQIVNGVRKNVGDQDGIGPTRWMSPEPAIERSTLGSPW